MSLSTPAIYTGLARVDRRAVPRDTGPMELPGYKRIVPWLLAHGNRPYERWMAERKRRLLTALTGTVVEIGPGAGANLPYLRRDVRWIGVEPNPYARPYLERAAREAGVVFELRDGNAERLPVTDASADAVIATLVLCSVADVGTALREIRRVLKPGGRFVFIEHVAAPAGDVAPAAAALGAAAVARDRRRVPSGPGHPVGDPRSGVRAGRGGAVSRAGRARRAAHRRHRRPGRDTT